MIEEAEGTPEEKHPNNILFSNLEKGNIVDQLKDNSKEYTRIQKLYDEAVQSMDGWLKKYSAAILPYTLVVTTLSAHTKSGAERELKSIIASRM